VLAGTEVARICVFSVINALTEMPTAPHFTPKPSAQRAGSGAGQPVAGNGLLAFMRRSPRPPAAAGKAQACRHCNTRTSSSPGPAARRQATAPYALDLDGIVQILAVPL